MSRVTLSELLVLLITARGLVENAPDLGPVTSGTGLLLMYLGSQNIVMVNVSILLINIFHDNKRIFCESFSFNSKCQILLSWFIESTLFLSSSKNDPSNI